MPLIFQRDSLYNYGGISPNNLVSYISTYNPVYYVSTGGYFGTGTTVFDLSPNKNNFTLNNFYAYSGGITFPGNNTYLISNDLINYFPSFNGQTQEVWFKNEFFGQTGSGVILSELDSSTINSTWHYSQFEIIGNTGYIGVWNNGITSIPIGSFNDGSWNCVSWRYDGTGLSGFVNGSRISRITTTRTSPDNFYQAIGATDSTNMGNGGYYKGQIGSYKVYNRAITDSEILQNYNYERQFFSLLTKGNGLTTMSITGLTSLPGVAGQDDAGATIPGITFDFYFFGINYGNGANSGIYWNTNSVLGFGPTNATIGWVANTGRGILIGNADRRTNNFYYSTTQSAGGYSYLNCLLFGQNFYNDGIANAVQFQLRFFRGPSAQYVEVRCKQAPSSAGAYNITNGTSFQNTFISPFTNMVNNQSFVLSSDLNGNNWTLYNNYYINL